MRLFLSGERVHKLTITNINLYFIALGLGTCNILPPNLEGRDIKKKQNNDNNVNDRLSLTTVALFIRLHGVCGSTDGDTYLPQVIACFTILLEL